MDEYFVRHMKAEEFRDFYRHIERDFLPEEHAPYAALHQQLKKGIQEGLVLCRDREDVAYSICAAGHDNGYVLISLLAVFEKYRSQGLGTAFLKVLRDIYCKKQAIIVEVEKPELADTDSERDSRVRRISFYERAGFFLIPGIDYTIWNVPMHLMALPVNTDRETVCGEIGTIMYQIYLQLMGRLFIHKLQLIVIDEK